MRNGIVVESIGHAVVLGALQANSLRIDLCSLLNLHLHLFSAWSLNRTRDHS